MAWIPVALRRSWVDRSRRRDPRGIDTSRDPNQLPSSRSRTTGRDLVSRRQGFEAILLSVPAPRVDDDPGCGPSQLERRRRGHALTTAADVAELGR